MADDERRQPGRRDDYRTARIVVALAFAAVLSGLLIIDALSPRYEVQTTSLVTMGALIIGLLGLEVKDIIRRD